MSYNNPLNNQSKEKQGEQQLISFTDLKLEEANGPNKRNAKSSEFSSDDEEDHNSGHAESASGFRPLSTSENFDIEDDQNQKDKSYQPFKEGKLPSWQEFAADSLEFLRKPSVLLTIILLSVVIILAWQYDAMQREFKLLTQQIKHQGHDQIQLQNQMRKVDKTLKEVKHIEQDLVKKELKLEEKVENVSEQTNTLLDDHNAEGSK